MTTVRDFIKNSLKKINVVGVGQDLTNEDAQDVLNIANGILSSWSIEGGLVYNQTIETFPITNGQASYTIGSGGTFDTAKPYEIDSVYVDYAGQDRSLNNLDITQYSNISDKDQQGLPTDYYFDNNYPLSTIYLYPSPSGVTSITIASKKPLTRFTSLTQEINVPEGYLRALEYNVAVESAPLFEKEASSTVQLMARESKAAVFNSNNKGQNNISGVDAALLVGANFNIYGGYDS